MRLTARSISVTAAAVTLFATPSSAAPPLRYARHVSPNGLEVLVAERHTAPLVTVEMAVHNGAMAEPPESNGFSHLYEHMFFKGNKALPDQTAYFTRLRVLGMQFVDSCDASTSEERVNYYFTTTSDHFADTMTFMRDAITSPLFDAKELERERIVVTGEMDRNEAKPRFNLWRAMTQRVFWKYPSRRDALGTRTTVLGATPEQLRALQDRYYVPNNSVLVVTGDVKKEEVFATADRLYAGWAKAPDPFVRSPLVHNPPIRRSEVVLLQQPVQTFTGIFEWQGPSTADASASDTYAADLLGALVADPASRFQKTLVDSGACVSASFRWSTARNVGSSRLDFESTEANVDDCVRAVVAEVGKLDSAAYFTDEQLRNAAHQLDVELAKQRQTTEGFAHQLTHFWASASLDYYGTYVERLKTVRSADIARYLDTYIVGKPFVFGAMESPKLSASIDRSHLEALVGLAPSAARTVGK